MKRDTRPKTQDPRLKTEDSALRTQHSGLPSAIRNPFDPNAAGTGGGIFGLPCTLEESRVILIPVPVEMTASYGGGTSRGPAAIREASKQVDLYDVQTGRPYEAGIFMLEESREIRRLDREGKALAKPIIARGGAIGKSSKLRPALERINALGARVNEIVCDTARDLIDRGKIVGVVGGDHSAPFGLIQAYAEKYPGLGILHIDAHADLRNAYEGFAWSHASIMHNVITRLDEVRKLVQIGIRDFCEAEMEVIERSRGRVAAHFDEDLQRKKFEGTSWKNLVCRIVDPLPKHVYISFDIDGLDPALCPHTGTPVPGGLSFQEAVYLISAVSRSGRTIVGFDLSEVAPGRDGGQWDANVGARLLYKLIGHTLLSCS